MDGDARGTDAGFPAVKPITGQCLLHSLYLWTLQIWGEGKQQVTLDNCPLSWRMLVPIQGTGGLSSHMDLALSHIGYKDSSK